MATAGSARTIVAFKKGKDCFFIYGFEKKEKNNITDNEEKAFKIVAKNLLEFSDSSLLCFFKRGCKSTLFYGIMRYKLTFAFKRML